ncbi:hypothetical protein [Microbacterium sulfonylureivorans]|uniref:hypothetical protein n=1 Tax=Microbacterium sulfonylureivorans TaxID=2486854 RepID=UPI0013DF53C0|nr:hypothetical protein [Microbacterium sulfonylureivorans]
MNIPRQMINLVGVVVVVALLVAGVTMIALPMWSSARSIDGDTATVAQTNEVYEVRVATLTGAQDEIEALTGEVSGLRRQIAASPQLDDVMQIVVDAARATGAEIQSVSAADPEPWTPRAGLAGDDAEAAPADEPAAAEGEAADDASGQAPATDDGAAAAEPAPETEPTASPQLQIPVTITVTVADADAAGAFIDALGRGPRLLATIDAAFEGDTLSVTTLALVRTED